MKIRDRINLGFFTLAVLGLVIGIAGKYGIDRNVDRFGVIVDQMAPGLRLLGEMEGDIHRIISESVSIVLLYSLDSTGVSRDEIEDEVAELNEAWDELDDRVNKLGQRNVSPLTAPEMRLLKRDLAELRESSRRIVESARSGQWASGEESLEDQKERLEILEGGLEDLLDAAALRQTTLLEEQRIEAREIAQNTSILNAGIAACSLIFVIYFAVMVNQKVSRPLSRLQFAAPRLGGTDSDFLINHDLPATGNDEIGQLSGALRDMDQRLRESTVSRDYVNAIIESMSDMLLVLDEEDRIVTVNRAVCDSIGKAEADLIGQPFFETLLADPSEIPEARAALGGELHNRRITLRGADGETIPVAFAAAHLQIGKATGMVCVARDIRVDLRREEELRQAREQAEAASRAKSEFLMNLSHEIRTPLHSVIGLSNLLAESSLSAEQDAHVHSLSLASNALLHLINNFLDLSRVESGHLDVHPVFVAPRDFVENLREIYKPQADAKNLQLNVTVAGNVPRQVRVDVDLLNQVLGNLIGNGIKFTETGAVNVSVHSDQVGELVFAIEDTGVGVPPEKQELIFEAFEQADNSVTRMYGGTGLGLALSKRLVTLLKGRIVLDRPATTGGSRFVVTVPVEIPEMPAANEAGGERKEIPRVRDPGPMTLLLVEDNENNQMLIKAFLRRTSVRLEIASHGQAALDLIDQSFRTVSNSATASDRLSYDLILMDMQMPVMDGYTATRAIRARESQLDLKRTPIVALTAHALDEARAQSMAAGCDDHVVKPIGKQALLDIVARFANGSSAAPM